MDIIIPNRVIPYQRYTLTLPPGNIKNLGVYFSNTIPCEIQLIEDDSPIFNETIELLGRIVFHVCIPNKIEIHGALDKFTLESILTTYPNIPDRKLIFKDRGERLEQDFVTTTVLPTGRIDASFRSSNGLFPSRCRVFVERSGYSNFAFPIGHYVEKIIIPNQFEIYGGVRTPQRLFEVLDHFAKVPGRKIVFRKNIPRGNIITKITLPEDHTTLISDVKVGEDNRKLPVVLAGGLGPSVRKLLIPASHVIEKVMIQNEISIERMSCTVVKKVLKHFANVEGRVIFLRESERDVPKAGGKVTITLPTGKLGMVFKSINNYIWLSDVRVDSPVQIKCPIGYYVESLVIPGEMELIGSDELNRAVFLSEKMREFSHVQDRILILKEYKQDIQTRTCGTKYTHEIV